jgi:hypothetical protein
MLSEKRLIWQFMEFGLVCFGNVINSLHCFDLNGFFLISYFSPHSKLLSAPSNGNIQKYSLFKLKQTQKYSAPKIFAP